MSQPGLVGGDMRRWSRRPRLQIEFELSRDVSQYNSSGTGWPRRFATVHVRNTGKDTAKHCVATVRVLSAPPEVELRQSEWTVHWAGVDYSGQTTGAEPVEIGHELRRLDVAFTAGPPEFPSQPGAWIAMPLALVMPAKTGQAFLPPGEYTIKLTVACENGKGSSSKFTLVSPPNWEGLSMAST